MRYFADKVKMPKNSKVRNSWSIFQNFFKSKSGHLLITTNPLTKFQGSSSNSFWDILLTRYKCPKLQRAITQEVFFKISSKVNQVVYSSLPVYSPSFKALASILFEIFCWQDCVHIFSKGHNSEKGHNPVKKKIRVSYFFMSNSYKKFQNSSIHGSKVPLCIKKHDERTDGRTTQKQYAPPPQLLGSWGHKKGHNSAKILWIITNMELDLYFTMIYPSANFQ